MKKILVHAHVFYPEIWAELAACIKNIVPYSYDLFVTLVEDNQELEQQIKAFNPQATIQLIDNKGFDVGAFVHVINQVNLDDYDYVIKLHTKRDVPVGARVAKKYDASGSKWRTYLLSFLKTKANFEQCLKAFDADATLGMCAHHCLITYKKLTSDDIFAFEQSELLLKEMDLPINSERIYVGGTMFMVRAALLKPLQNLQINLDSFEKPDRKIVRSKAHILERLFGALVTSQGYTIKDGFTSEKDLKQIEIKTFWQRLRECFYMVRVSRSGKRTTKILKIPVWRRKVITKNK